MPQLFTHNVDILKDFFGSLSTEEVSVRVSIQEALAQLCPAYIAAAPEKTEQIIALLLQMTEKSDTQSRYLAMFYANRLFPFNHVSARYINLLGAADMQRQVSDEGARGLQPYVLKDNDLIPNSAEPFPDLFSTSFAQLSAKRF
jgi:proteasome component ECM29